MPTRRLVASGSSQTFCVPQLQKAEFSSLLFADVCRFSSVVLQQKHLSVWGGYQTLEIHLIITTVSQTLSFGP